MMEELLALGTKSKRTAAMVPVWTGVKMEIAPTMNAQKMEPPPTVITLTGSVVERKENVDLLVHLVDVVKIATVQRMTKNVVMVNAKLVQWNVLDATVIMVIVQLTMFVAK